MNQHDTLLNNSFDNWSENYDVQVEEKLRLRGYSYDKLAELFAVELMRFVEPHVVAEIGTGPGTLGKRLARQKKCVREIHGVDVSDGMLRLAKQTGAYSSLTHAAADKHKYNPDTTAIVTSFALHSVESIDDLFNHIRELPELKLAVIVDLYPANEIVLAESRKHSALHEHGAPEHYKTVEMFTDLLKKLNWDIVNQTQLGIEKDYNHWMTTVTPR